jgi:hypothetical protein
VIANRHKDALAADLPQSKLTAVRKHSSIHIQLSVRLGPPALSHGNVRVATPARPLRMNMMRII